MDFERAKPLFLETIRKSQRFASATTLLYWDMQTIMPPKGADARAQVLGAMQGEIFRLTTSEEYGAAIAALKESEGKLSPREQRMLEKADFDYSRFRKIPAALFEEYSIACAEASHVWMEAKNANDFETFRPHLQKMIDYSREFAELWGYEKTPYDAMLEDYDPALLTAQIDPIFARLREGTRELLDKAGRNVQLPRIAVDAVRQKLVGEYLLRVIGYDLAAGSLYTTEHPFTSGVHMGDIRVTTKYHVNNPLSSIFSVLHEGGHGIYEQNVDPVLDGTNLFDGASMGIHESQSRFFENIIGRSQVFWARHLPVVNELCGVQLAASAEEFFKGINAVQPSLIRIEADELTYNLHIIVRYECEKAIFNDKVNAPELPELWREKYKEILGVAPETYTDGVMQDSHWSGGSFGYFPSYAIGNLCAAQFAHAFETANGPLAKYIASDEGLAKVVDWLKGNIHRGGASEKPEQIMRRVCGEDVNPEYFLRYMENKLKSVYNG